MEGLSIEYVDIAPLLRRAAAALPSDKNTVIHSEAFSLFEAMSAVEIGNVKMDVGLQAMPKTVDQLIEEGLAPEELSPEQTLAVMNRLFEMEATWHHGGSLAQTVYSCIYMLRPERISQNACLSAFCLALGQTCSLVRAMIMQGGVVEEEDCNVHVFGLPVDDQTEAISNGPECLAALSKALEFCTAKIDTLESSDIEKVKWELISKHLVMRSELLTGIQAVLYKGRPDMEHASACFSKALASIHSTPEATPEAAKGKTVPSGSLLVDTDESSSSLSASSAPGFDDNVNRNLVIPCPPRTVKVLSGSAAVTYFRTSLEHLVQALQVRSLTSFEALHDFCIKFAGLRAGPLARSVAHYVLLPQAWGLPDPSTPPPPLSSSHSPEVVPQTSTACDENGLPAFAVSRTMIGESCGIGGNAYGRIGHDVDLFLEQSVIAVANWCQAMFMNPCRTRRRLRKGLGDWGNLFDHAVNADFSEEFQAHMESIKWRWVEPKGDVQVFGPLATWVERETAGCMVQHLLMGFELDLYEPKDYTMIYWYCDVLISAQKSAAQLLLDTIPPPKAAAPKLPPRGLKGGKKPPASLPPPASDPAHAAWEGRRRVMHSEVVQLERTHFMLSGCLRAMLAIKAMGLLKDPPLPFNTALQRFDQRFSSFHSSVTHPEPVSYPDFVASTDTKGFNPTQLLQLATQSFDLVRQLSQHELSQKKELPVGSASPKDMARVAFQNTLACGILSKTMSQQQEGGSSEAVTSNMTVTYDFSTLQFYPALGVKR